jgi:hypothetical protein
MQLRFLADHEQAIPIVANWYRQEWGHLEQGNTVQIAAQRLRDYLNKDKLPLIILAVEDGEVLGAAQLKYREMDIYPEKEHWL